MIDVYRKLNSLFDRHERKRAGLLLGLMVIMAFVETVGVASIMPFIAVLAKPEVIETNRLLRGLYEGLDFDSEKGFLLFLGSVFFVILIFSLTLRAFGLWTQMRFSNNRDCAWSVRLVKQYLRQPYEWFLNRHSSELGTSVLAEVNEVVGSSLFPAMQIIAHVLVATFMVILLLIADPVLTLSVCGGLVGGYMLVSFALKPYLIGLGQERQKANRQRFHAIQEAFGGIKDVKLGGHESVFASRFSTHAQRLARFRISAGMIAELPTFAMQGLLFGGMLLLLLYLIASRGSFAEAVPVAALYAFAGYRLMPAIQSIYYNLTQIRFSQAALDSLCADLSDSSNRVSTEDGTTSDGVRVRLKHAVEMSSVSYAYPGAPGPALRSVSLVIPACSTVGLVGSTGSGKTTTVDLLLGLLRPAAGTLRVDGVEITDERVRGWQRSLGYVPQQIYLSDDSVAGNIAFGQPENEIDMAAVERAARTANLHDFVINELTQGYRTPVGERGVRLSGGQRQRIGIARALYHDPDVLILDEATSALDNLTEQAVMEAVRNLANRKTVVLIAHRLSTVRACDRIYMLEHGEVVADGTYDELLVKSDRFRAMAELA